MAKDKSAPISDNPSTASLKAALPAVKLVSKIAGVVGMTGSKKAADIKAAADNVLEQAKILDVPDRFNDAFASQGWIATGSFSVEVMTQALDFHAVGNTQDARQAIVEWFDEENISLFCIQRSRQHHHVDLRDEQLREALQLYLEERYIAAVPLILIACDGMASDVAGYSPFKSDADLSCFDSIVGHESALPQLIGRLTTGVRKSSDDPMVLPNRNGILHGRSLGYANKELCAKAWMVYLALVDWASDKSTEQERLKRYEEEQSFTLRDALEGRARIRRDRETMDEFAPTEKFAPFDDLTDPDLPEAIFNAFFEGWRKSNFGQMAENAMNRNGDALKKRAGEMRQMTEFVELIDYELTTVRHAGVARAEALVKVTAKAFDKPVSGTIAVLAFRLKSDGDVEISLDEGRWLVQQICIYSVMNETFEEAGNNSLENNDGDV